MPPRDPAALRRRLAEARLMLLFTPDLCGGRDPLEVLEAALGSIDMIQIRPKSLASVGPCPAAEARDWTLRVLDLLSSRSDLDVPVILDDRVDVAAALLERGCAGVHLGQDDCPAAVARAFLGPSPLVGLSTHDMRQVALASDEPVDYLGFGPIHPTPTKGYERGLGSEAVWVASQASPFPVFPIGGIDSTNVGELARVGRSAVGSAVLGADDPGRAARELRDLLSDRP